MKPQHVERLTMGIVVLLLVALNSAMVCKYNALFSVVSDDYAKQLSYLFHVSGFDPNSYAILTEWSMHYDVLRHPLLPYLMALPSWFNHLLITTTGVNAALYIAALIALATGMGSAVFLFRLLHQVVGLRPGDASLLTLLMFSFGYIQVTYFVPDHFGLSLMLILLGLYLIGKAWKEQRILSLWQTATLLLLTGGVTLTNAAKVVVATGVAQGRRFFHVRRLAFGIALPSVLLLGLALWEQHVYVTPKEEAAKAYEQAHKEEVVAQARANHQRYKKAPWVIHKGKPFGQGSLMRWTDQTTSRMETLKENVFGETLVLHETHVLEDILTSYRPVMLRYQQSFNYFVTGLLLILSILGIACGYDRRVLWMTLCGIIPDALMHLGLGFAINEIYIMAAHWVYVIPVSIAFAFASLKGKTLWALRAAVTLLTLYLMIHNLGLLATWMQEAPVSTAFWYE